MNLYANTTGMFSMRHGAVLAAVCVLCMASCDARAEKEQASVNLDNLVPYTNTMAAWSDRHSNITLTWVDPAAPGLQQLVSMAERLVHDLA